MKYWLKKIWHRITDYDYEFDFTKVHLEVPRDYIDSIEMLPRQIIINLNHDLLVKTSGGKEKEG